MANELIFDSSAKKTAVFVDENENPKGLSTFSLAVTVFRFFATQLCWFWVILD